jgi:PAT family beta-lactamase induction signal transducer AmpG
MEPITKTARSAWRWIPTLYFGQGIPYVVVMTLAVVMYKKMGLSNSDIALYTSWLYLPWVIKPLWSPFIEMFRTKRFWIVAMQLLIGAALALVALTLPTSNFFQITLALFWLMAFSSATHDIAADGFYMLALKEQQQAAFVGVRSTFYRIAMIAGQGGLVYIAGHFEERTGNVTQAWSTVFFILAAMFCALFIYHKFVLPTPASDHATRDDTPPWQQFWSVFVKFMQKPEIISILAFLLLFRFAEAQLVKLAAPFLLDGRESGGLGLTTQDLGVVYGTVGVIALTLGGLLGGYAISRLGLKRWLWIMVAAVNLPNIVYVYLALALPTELTIIATAVAIEQFGYGFGFTAYMMFMIMVADGAHKTAHYALCTGFMALGMMLPGMASGWIQEQLGYLNFFIWICIATLPSFIATAFIKVKPEFGRRQE